LLYKLPHALVVHTPKMRDDLIRDFRVDATLICVMEHGIDRLLPPPPGAANWLIKRYGLAPGTRVLLCFGAVARYKGIDAALAAMEILPADTVLVIAGYCRDEALRRDLRALAAPMMSKRRVHWFDGFVPEDKVAAYFHGADLLLMPYLNIDQSGVIFMAMATGLPVVATAVGSLADYVPLTGGMLVESGSIESLRDGIEAALVRQGQVDRDAVATEAAAFLWSKTIRPVLQLYAPTAPETDSTTTLDNL